MKVIRNKTRKPIQVPLGGGKLLRLGPGKTGQVAPQATGLPAFCKMVEQGEIEVVEEGAPGSGVGPTGRVHESTRGHKTQRIQRRGDR